MCAESQRLAFDGKWVSRASGPRAEALEPWRTESFTGEYQKAQRLQGIGPVDIFENNEGARYLLVSAVALPGVMIAYAFTKSQSIGHR